MDQPDACAICGRNEVTLTRHHPIPRTRHANKRNKKLFARSEVRTRLAWLCPPCHRRVHQIFTEKELESRFNTLESLAQHPEIQKFAAWIAKRPPGFKPRRG